MGAYLNRLVLCTIAFLSILVVTAAGQDATPVADQQIVLPIGEWIGFGIDVILSGLAIIVTWLFRQIPGQIGALLMTARADQALTKAVEYGLNAVKDAAASRELKIHTANQVALVAYKYFNEHGNALIIQFAGTRQQIIEKIWARLKVEPAAEIKASTGTPQAV